MRSLKVMALLFCVGFLMTVFAPRTHASEMDKKTLVTFREAVELPGGVALQPGDYTMKVVLYPGSNVVQFLNRDENEVYATVFTISTERMEPTEQTVITLHEAFAGKTAQMDAWFYPGRRIGWEFPVASK